MLFCSFRTKFTQFRLIEFSYMNKTETCSVYKPVHDLIENDNATLNKSEQDCNVLGKTRQEMTKLDKNGQI